MPSVMDINHLLCQPCDPYVSKKQMTIYSSTETRPFFVHRPIPIEFYQPTYRQRSHSEILCSPQKKKQNRKRSNSTPVIQTRVPWTPEEDDLLQKGYEQGLSWAMISFHFLPHRSRGCCWGRFKTLQNKNAIEVYQQRICQRPWRINRPHPKK